MLTSPDGQAPHAAPSLGLGGPAKLAICLPTYNRCELLGESLADLIAVVRPHNIPIHVSDNNSDDATEAGSREAWARWRSNRRTADTAA